MPTTTPNPRSDHRQPGPGQPGHPQPGRWLALDGAVNARDAGGLPAGDGHRIAPRRLLRSDNLQDLTDADVSLLVAGYRLTDVVDLRSDYEVDKEGPGPLTRRAEVCIHHLSLLPETPPTQAAERKPAVEEILPWQAGELAERDRSGQHVSYLGYLDDRADSMVAALRVVGAATGATLVHCAAGKDRAGMVTAFALEIAGVPRQVVLDDYMLTNERIGAIVARLAGSPTYAAGVLGRNLDELRPHRASMALVFDTIDAEHGGVLGWLRGHGWTEPDTEAVRAKLLD